MMDKKSLSFSLPKKIDIMQSANMHLLLKMLLIFGPWIIVVIIGYLSILTEIGFGIIFAISTFYVIIITNGIRTDLRRPVRGMLNRFQNISSVKWILQNIKCPNCDGEITVKKPYGDMEDCFFQHEYKCKYCNRRYFIDIITDEKNKYVFKPKK